jgi:gamma-glutamylcysteine synthetase
MNTFEQRLGALSAQTLTQIRRGIEKESLRVQPDGSLALTAHARALGSPLTHPHITTDFSESQLELITGAHTRTDACLEELTRVHQVVYRALAEQGDEALWACSMPCKLPPDDGIPLGRYGDSNVGRMKTVYRNGLAYRYGRRMQTISGIHYNFSLPGLTSADYFALIRNFRRHSWLPLYLFGASPATCASFVEGREHGLQALRDGTMYLPHATSLRMGRLGYQSEAQATLCVSYNNLDSYAASLDHALTRPYAAYEKIGLRGPDGEYRQLATTLLQIENEFYGTVRPKRRIRPGERPLHALRERGVEYVEVRLMDLDPFEAVGISAQTMRFLDVFLLHCLLQDSPPDTPDEIRAIGRNQHTVAARWIAGPAASRCETGAARSSPAATRSPRHSTPRTVPPRTAAPSRPPACCSTTRRARLLRGCFPPWRATTTTSIFASASCSRCSMPATCADSICPPRRPPSSKRSPLNPSPSRRTSRRRTSWTSRPTAPSTWRTTRSSSARRDFARKGERRRRLRRQPLRRLVSLRAPRGEGARCRK